MPKLLALLVLVAALAVAALPGIAAASPASTVAAKPGSPAETDKQPRAGDKRRSTSEKRGHDDTVTPNRGTIDPVGAVARGQVVEIRATALASGQVCALHLFYADKAAPIVRDVVPDKAKRCAFSVTVPERPGAVGEAKAVVTFTKVTSGKRVGTARQAFTVN